MRMAKRLSCSKRGEDDASLNDVGSMLAGTWRQLRGDSAQQVGSGPVPTRSGRVPRVSYLALGVWQVQVFHSIVLLA